MDRVILTLSYSTTQLFLKSEMAPFGSGSGSEGRTKKIGIFGHEVWFDVQ